MEMAPDFIEINGRRIPIEDINVWNDIVAQLDTIKKVGHGLLRISDSDGARFEWIGQGTDFSFYIED